MKILSCFFALLVGSLSILTISAQETTKQEILAAAAPKRDNPKPIARNYRLGPGDRVELKVPFEQQFEGKYTVDEEGKIILPFVEAPLQVGCRTEQEVNQDIGLALSKYLKKPSYTVQVERLSRPPAAVFGEVRNPQRFELQRQVRLLELLSYAGGWTEKAGGVIQVFRTQPTQCPEPGEEAEPSVTIDGSNMPFKVYKLSEVRSGRNDANPMIRPGDVVTVEKAPPIYVVGEVRMPPSSQDPITIPEQGLNLTDAIARAGGLTREAKKKDVRIYRQKPGSKEPELIAANLEQIKNKKQPDIALQPFDVIEVEKAPKSISQYMTEFLTGGIGASLNALPLRIIY